MDDVGGCAGCRRPSCELSVCRERSMTIQCEGAWKSMTHSLFMAPAKESRGHHDQENEPVSSMRTSVAQITSKCT